MCGMRDQETEIKGMSHHTCAVTEAKIGLRFARRKFLKMREIASA